MKAVIVCVWVLVSASWGHAAETPPPLNQEALMKPASAYSAQVPIEWFQLTLQLVQQTPGFSPPVAARALGYLGLTLYESVVPGMPKHQTLAGQLNELDSLPWAQPDEPLHWPTVANAAMATMVRMMFPTASADHKSKINLLERNLPIKYPQDFDPAFLTVDITNRSETFGKLMGMSIMTWARTDGGHEAWGPLRKTREKYVPPSEEGNWSPTPAFFEPPLLPFWGENRPFVIASGKTCDPPNPPVHSDKPNSTFYKEAMEVYRISNNATKEQRQYSLYWADDPGKTPTPAGHWVYLTNDLLKERKANLAEAAEIYAKLNLAMSDGFVSCWQTKYKTNVIRPVTYIQLHIDSNWVTTLMNTPPFPEFTSGHSVQSAAAAAVLGSFFGTHTRFVDNTHNDRGWGPRSFDSFQAAADEAAMSRMYAGIHFRTAVELGKVQGRCVAQKVLDLKFKR